VINTDLHDVQIVKTTSDTYEAYLNGTELCESPFTSREAAQDALRDLIDGNDPKDYDEDYDES